MKIVLATWLCLSIQLVASGFPLSKAHVRAHLKFNSALKRKQVFDAAIVTGIPVDNGKWNKTMRERVLWACLLYHKGVVCNLIFSGSAVYTPYHEGEVMATYAKALGVRPEHIHVESRARHSTENVYFSYLLAKEKGFKKLALTTDPYQSMMLMFHTRNRYVSHITHLPVVKKHIRHLLDHEPEVDLNHTIKKNFISIKEIKTLRQRLYGTLGKHLDFGHDGLLGTL